MEMMLKYILFADDQISIFDRQDKLTTFTS
jgi:hypothetical protein